MLRKADVVKVPNDLFIPIYPSIRIHIYVYLYCVYTYYVLKFELHVVPGTFYYTTNPTREVKNGDKAITVKWKITIAFGWTEKNPTS